MATNNLPIAKATSLALRSLHEFNFEPDVYRTLYKTYGEGFNSLYLWRSMNLIDSKPVSNLTMTAHQQGYDVRTVTLDTVTPVDTNNVTFTLDAGDVDEQGNYYPRVGFTLVFGDVIDGFTQARITSVSSDGGSPATVTVQCERYNSDAPTFTEQISNGHIATGVEVGIFDGVFAVGTGQPDPTSLGLIEREFDSQVFKESIGFEGMELAQKKYAQKEGLGYFIEELTRVEFALDRQIESASLMGQANNRDLSQVSLVSGANNKAYKFKGIWPWVDELGGEVTYTNANGIEFDDFDEMAAYFESQGVTESVILVLCGGNFKRRVENSGVTFTTGSAGNLPTGKFFHQKDGMIMSGAPDTYLNIGFEGIKKGGNLFLFKTLNMFTNPFQYGMSGYKLHDAALAFPMAMVKDAKSGDLIPNLSYKYVGIKGYSRQRVAGGMAGMDGFMQQNYQFPLVSQIDGNNFYWLSHLLMMFMEANKGMIIRRSN